MNATKETISILRKRKWPIKAIAFEVGVHEDTIWGWIADRQAPRAGKAIEKLLRSLLKRKPPVSSAADWRIGAREEKP